MFNFFGNSGGPFPPGMGPLPSGPNPGKVDSQKLYQVLGVPKTAPAGEIKKAYRKLAVQWHPDKNPENQEEAEQKFKEISKSYQILSDTEKRKMYDMYGERALQDIDSGGGDAEDLFSSIFGNRANRRGPSEEVPPIVTDLELTLEEFYSGGTFSVEVTRTITTDLQGETRPGGMVKCSGCEGEGAKTQMRQMGPGMFQQCRGACDKCQGKGFTVLPGYVTAERSEVISVQVDPGMMEGQHVIISGKGSPDVFRPGYFGDVAVRLRCKRNVEEQNWKRQKVHLIYRKEIDVFEALMGVEFIIKHLNGGMLRIAHNAVIKPDTMKKIVGKGMPYPDGSPQSGDLYILFRVKFPENISERQRKLLKTVRRAFSVPTTAQINLSTDQSSADAEKLQLIDLELLPDNNPNNHSGQDDSEEDSDDSNGGNGGEGVACAQQ